jgi:hypothetical protein
LLVRTQRQTEREREHRERERERERNGIFDAPHTERERERERDWLHRIYPFLLFFLFSGDIATVDTLSEKSAINWLCRKEVYDFVGRNKAKKKTLQRLCRKEIY